MLKVSESYIVGIDISTDDEYMATINRIDGMLIKPVAVVTGEDAKTIYDIINKGE
jgi:hypothetical protein